MGDFKDGTFFVPLAPLRKVENILQTIAESIKVPLATKEDPKHQLLRFLENRELLLVIDNVEHLLEGVGFLSEILAAAPRVKILAASRERLNLQSETVFNVTGMHSRHPAGGERGEENEAVTLFVQSARKVRPGFVPDAAQLTQIETICQIVEGMPLAIELAAAWLNLLNLTEIIAELEKGLDILTTGVRDAPERHRSIRSVFDYSWSLIDPDEKATFIRLSVFRGGFTREAAAQVAGASLTLLAGLVDKSFISHDPNSGRLEIHELLRYYAQEHLEKDPLAWSGAQVKHADYFSDFTQRKGLLLRGQHQMQALAEIEPDIENIRAAWHCLLEKKDAPGIWKMQFGLWHVYWIRWWNYAGMVLFGEAVDALHGEQDQETVAAHGMAMALQSYFMAWLGVPEQGYELAKQGIAALEEYGHPGALVLALDCLAINAYMFNRYAAEIEVLERMRVIALEGEDRWLLAFCLFGLGMGALVRGEYSAARQYAEEELILYQELGDVIGSTMPLIVLGHAALACGELEQARGYYLDCMQIAEGVGFHYSTQTATKYLGKVTVSLGDIEAAENYLHKSLELSKEIGFLRDMTRLLYEYARLRRVQGKLEESVELLSFVLAHPASDQYRWLEGYLRDNISELLVKLKGEMPPEEYNAAVEQGNTLQLGKVVDEILASHPNS